MDLATPNYGAELVAAKIEKTETPESFRHATCKTAVQTMPLKKVLSRLGTFPERIPAFQGKHEVRTFDNDVDLFQGPAVAEERASMLQGLALWLRTVELIFRLHPRRHQILQMVLRLLEQTRNVRARRQGARHVLQLGNSVRRKVACLICRAISAPHDCKTLLEPTKIGLSPEGDSLQDAMG